MLLYFVVRTDIDEKSGSQRVFGAYDNRDDAKSSIVELSRHFAGIFDIYLGRPG